MYPRFKAFMDSVDGILSLPIFHHSTLFENFLSPSFIKSEFSVIGTSLAEQAQLIDGLLDKLLGYIHQVDNYQYICCQHYLAPEFRVSAKLKLAESLRDVQCRLHQHITDTIDKFAVQFNHIIRVNLFLFGEHLTQATRAYKSGYTAALNKLNLPQEDIAKCHQRARIQCQTTTLEQLYVLQVRVLDVIGKAMIRATKLAICGGGDYLNTIDLAMERMGKRISTSMAHEIEDFITRYRLNLERIYTD